MMNISIQHIRRKYRHLYYQDGPVKLDHLLQSVAAKARAQRKAPHLMGLAPEPPK